MLSSILCRPNKQKPIVSNLFLSQQNETIDLIVSKIQATDEYLRSLNFNSYLLVACLLILGNSLLCISAQALESPSCFCNGKLYRFCPEECRNKPAPRSSLDDLLEENLMDKHPDHLYNSDRVGAPEAVKQMSMAADVQGSFKEEDGEIVVHRKVYVTTKPAKHPIIHPVKITVPVTFKDQSLVLDAPEPVFKLRTYTEYETKPETIQVPVVTTVIKPKNVKRDQIIFS